MPLIVYRVGGNRFRANGKNDMTSFQAVGDAASSYQMVRAHSRGLYDVAMASDGDEVLQAAESRSDNAVLTGVDMPDMDQGALTGKLLQLQEYSSNRS